MTEANETLCAVCGDVLDAEWDTGIGTERPHPTDHIFIPVPREPSLHGEGRDVSIEDALLVFAEILSGRPGLMPMIEELLRRREQIVRAEERAAAEAGYGQRIAALEADTREVSGFWQAAEGREVDANNAGFEWRKRYEVAEARIAELVRALTEIAELDFVGLRNSGISVGDRAISIVRAALLPASPVPAPAPAPNGRAE